MIRSRITYLDVKDAKLKEKLPPGIEGTRVKIFLNQPREFGGENIYSSFMVWEPGGIVPLHYHNCEEFQYVLYGYGTLGDIEGRERPLQSGIMFHCPAGIGGAHEVRNTGDVPFALIFFYPAYDGSFHLVTKDDTARTN